MKKFKLHTVPRHISIPEKIDVLQKALGKSFNQIMGEYIHLVDTRQLYKLYKELGIQNNLQHNKFFKYLPYEGWDNAIVEKKTDLAIRIAYLKIQVLCKLTETTNLSEAMTVAICTINESIKNGALPPVQNNPIKKEESHTLSLENLFDLPGNKNDFIDIFINIFTQVCDCTKFIDVCGGTGILTAAASSSGNFKNITYNDFDTQKYNLMNFISNESEIMFLCRHMGIDIDIDSLSEKAINADKDIIEAVKYYMENNKKIKRENILTKLQMYIDLLKGINVTNRDCVEVIRENIGKKNTFLMIDLPYRYAKGYDIQTPNPDDEKGFSLAKHEEIDKMLIRSKATFLYCCRITAPQDYNGTTVYNDYCIKGMIDEAFSGKGLYYLDCPKTSNGDQERIISNRQFKGFLPY